MEIPKKIVDYIQSNLIEEVNFFEKKFKFKIKFEINQDFVSDDYKIIFKNNKNIILEEIKNHTIDEVLEEKQENTEETILNEDKKNKNKFHKKKFFNKKKKFFKKKLPDNNKEVA